jgi:hypothetical protein
MSQTPQNSSQNFCNKLQVCSSIFVPPNCCTVTLKFVPAASAQNIAINVVRMPWEMCQNFQKTAQILLKICAKRIVVLIVWNPYSMNCTFCLGFRALFSCCTEFKNPYSTAFSAGLFFASISMPSLLVVWPAQSIQYGLPSMLSLLPRFLC